MWSKIFKGPILCPFKPNYLKSFMSIQGVFQLQRWFISPNLLVLGMFSMKTSEPLLFPAPFRKNALSACKLHSIWVELLLTSKAGQKLLFYST